MVIEMKLLQYQEWKHYIVFSRRKQGDRCSVFEERKVRAPQGRMLANAQWR